MGARGALMRNSAEAPVLCVYAWSESKQSDSDTSLGSPLWMTRETVSVLHILSLVLHR